MKDIELGNMNTLDDSHLRASYNLVSSKISHARKNVRKIENENLQLLKRINNASPTIRSSKMRMDRHKQVKLLKLKGRFPYTDHVS